MDAIIYFSVFTSVFLIYNCVCSCTLAVNRKLSHAFSYSLKPSFVYTLQYNTAWNTLHYTCNILNLPKQKICASVFFSFSGVLPACYFVVSENFREMANQPFKLVNKQFNSPINLYSEQNVRNVLERETQILNNGAVG